MSLELIRAGLNKIMLNKLIVLSVFCALMGFTERCVATSAESRFSQIEEKQITHFHEESIDNEIDEAIEKAYYLRDIPQKRVANLDKVKAQLTYCSDNPKCAALDSFFSKRTVSNASRFLKVAKTPLSRAIAYMCLAEAYYAQNKPTKAILYATLALAHHYSEHLELQAKFYLTNDSQSDLSLKGSREDVLARLNEAMDNSWNPQQFRRYFSMATVVGLLPSYPLKIPNQTMDPVQIIMAFDNNFAPHAIVTILSAMLSAKPNSQYVFNIMEDADNPLDGGFKKRILDFVEEVGAGRFQVSFHTVDKSILPEGIRHIEKFRIWPRLVFFKLFIPEIFSESERVLWLDADMIITRDLTELYTVPMQGNWFAGVRDREGYKASSYLPVEDDAPYLNVGMVVYDVAAINAERGSNRVEEYCLKHPDFSDTLQYPEQDMFTLIYPDKILEIEEQQPAPGPDGKVKKPLWNWFYAIEEESHWKKVHDHPVGIIHLAGGKLKPWNRKFSPTLWSTLPKKNDGVQNMYWALRDMSPWPMR